MIEVYYWEDDDQAEDVFDALKERELDYKAIVLDPESPGARTCVTTAGKTYWGFSEFLESLD